MPRLRPFIHSCQTTICAASLLAALAFVGAGDVRAQTADSTLTKRFQLAESFMRAGQFDRAVMMLEDLYRARPDAHVFYERLREGYENLKAYDQAIALVDEQLERRPMPLFQAERARLLHLSGDTDAALRAWERAIAMRPSDASTYRTVYQSMVQVRQFDAAIDVLLRGRKMVGEETSFHGDLAQLYVYNGAYAEAVREYMALLEKDEKQFGFVRTRMARLVDEPVALEAAVEETRRAVRHRPLVQPIREIMAWLYLESEQYLEALDAYRALDRLGDQDGRALFAFAQQAGDAGAFQAATEAYEELLTRYPESPIVPDAWFGQAHMREQEGRKALETLASGVPTESGARSFDMAIQGYRQYIQQHSGHSLVAEARYRVARILWEIKGELGEARAELERLIATSPAHPIADEARVDLGILALTQGQLEEARRTFARIIDGSSRAELVARARYQLALSHFYAGDVETALTVASAVNRHTSMDVANDAIELRVLIQENKGPDSLNTVLKQFGQAAFFERAGQFDQAVQSIDSLLSLHGNHPIADDARFARARLLRSRGDYEAAWTAFAEIPLLHRQSPISDRALFHAAEVLAFDLRNTEEAVEYLTRLLTDYPGSVLASDARSLIRRLRGDGV